MNMRFILLNIFPYTVSWIKISVSRSLNYIAFCSWCCQYRITKSQTLKICKQTFSFSPALEKQMQNLQQYPILFSPLCCCSAQKIQESHKYLIRRRRWRQVFGHQLAAYLHFPLRGIAAYHSPSCRGESCRCAAQLENKARVREWSDRILIHAQKWKYRINWKLKN